MNKLRSNTDDLDQHILQYLASQVGPEKVNLIPSYLHEIDLDSHLVHKNMAIASSVIISGLVNDVAKDRIIQAIRYEYLRAKSFHAYLYEIILNQFKIKGDISIAEITAKIPDHSLKYYMEAPNEGDLKADYYNWAQILKMKPTESQIERAIELRLLWAQKKGLIPDKRIGQGP